MTIREENAERKSKGVAYTLSTGVLFLILVGLADSQCRDMISWSLTASCVEHIANSATVSAAYAAVYGIFAPQAFRAVFGRLIEVIIRIWARATGRTLPAPVVSPSRAAPMSAAVPPSVASDPPPSAARWTVPREALLTAVCAVVFVGLAVALVVRPPMPLPHDRVEGARGPLPDDGQPPLQPAPEAGQLDLVTRPATHTIVDGDTCSDIAKAYCIEAQWPRFQEYNRIRVVSRNGQQQCVLRAGSIYQLPPEWNDETCKAPTAGSAAR
jgi:hypothetical protein